jgi:hypothetical protein
MRARLLPAVLAAIAIALPQGAAAGRCVAPGDEAAFAVQALKSGMMLAAVGCGAQARYNAAVRRFRPDIAAQERRVMAWFGAAYGGSGRSHYDDYISELANVQSLAAVRELGAGFCAEAVGIFPEIMKLRRGADLPGLAARKGYAQPAEPQRCEGGAAAPAAPDVPAARTPPARTPGARAVPVRADRTDGLPPTSMHRPSAAR